MTQQQQIVKRLRKGWTTGLQALTPFMGVGSEVYSPVSMGRKAIGIELKDSYFKQAKINLELASKRFDSDNTFKQESMFELEMEAE